MLKLPRHFVILIEIYRQPWATVLSAKPLVTETVCTDCQKRTKKRKMWLKNLKLGIMDDDLLKTKKDVRVCFRHFQDSDYRIIGTTRRLKPGM